jgi:hypothetical protein
MSLAATPDSRTQSADHAASTEGTAAVETKGLEGLPDKIEGEVNEPLYWNPPCPTNGRVFHRKGHFCEIPELMSAERLPFWEEAATLVNNTSVLISESRRPEADKVVAANRGTTTSSKSGVLPPNPSSSEIHPKEVNDGHQRPSRPKTHQ